MNILTDDELRRTVDAVEKHPTHTAAAAALGINRRSISDRLKVAARRGIAPGHFDQGVAPGYMMGKVTIHRDEHGIIKNTWERQHPDENQIHAAIEAAVEALSSTLVPAPPSAKVRFANEDLLTLYTFTDYHVGMLAWAKEGGADWDLKIAEELGVKAMNAMVCGAPKSKVGVVNIQGDFLHWDGLTAITPTHGHVLDADGRFGKVVDVAIKLIRQLVSEALTKHEEIILLICEGNHDLASSLWLRKLFALYYSNDPRITIHDSELPFYAMEWGNTMLGLHHGHMKKNESLGELFSAQFRPMWGRCPKVYIHTGHRHHKDVKDRAGCRIIQHPTLAARDAHCARGGWWSEREITAITYSKKFGWAGDYNVTPEMVMGL